MTTPSSPPPPTLDPPFRGYIETTFDALLVFEAARRGMIPRVTRRLIERERGMVQSGAVFVFDEHESGIKRWTDGLVWSPSRILGNFLVYRETDKRSPGTPTKQSSTSPPETSPSGSTPHGRPGTATLGMSGFDSPTGLSTHIQPSVMDAPSSSSMHGMTEPPPLGQGALARPRSASEGGGAMDRQRERQLVGSLTNSYKFKEGGLVKKTMSVSVNGFNQHMVSYYSVQDVLAGKLRAPSTIPELSSLEISQEYLNKQNFRFPPMIERGPDGINRYRGEAEEPQSPTSPNSQFSFQSFPASSSHSGEYYDGAGYPQMTSHAPRVGSPRNRSVTVPMSVPLPPHTQSYVGPSSHGSTYYESPTIGTMHYAPSLARQSSSSSIHSSASGAIRPSSSSRRYDPYGGAAATSPRLSGGMQYQPNLPHRRMSQPMPPENMYSPPNTASYDVKPNPYSYHPPSTAPSTFSAFYPPDGGPDPHGGHPGHHPHHIQSPITSPATTTFATAPSHGYAAWQPVPQHQQPGGVPPSSSGSDSTSRLLPTINTRTDFGNPPSSAGSGSTSGGSRITSGQQPSPLQSSQTAASGPDPWVHPQSTVAESAPNVWSDGAGNGSNGQYVQPIHQHDDWVRSNAGAIV
ncbi:hypothetical protein I302_103622 [Kwoniella bestiolae CBS 10118]|uniref:cAMP-independent regulatory protein n=1 Tax=Kwoniella bestiolae CBS 10118 TaxID=1296100 RepID=A0A1B9G904_9TREE|nr:hypothetical protein I302_02325 [Kwoniella bestiolae CBS 10118]OCF27483.1 hypothetical protein I302_02325 [Kwoniella bestiolae CBS 10118]